jgi:uncharacterized lipoprotein YmbA
MKKSLVLTALIFLGSLAGFAQNIAGDWHGTLHAGPAELRLALHFTKTADGGYTATMDSLDQGAIGIPITAVSLKDSKLNLTVDAVHGTYEGKVNADGTELTGTWTQNQSLPLDFTRGSFPVKSAPKAAKPTDIDGNWLGTIDTGAGKLRVEFHVTNTEEGLTATMNSVDQGNQSIPVTTVTRNVESLKMELKSIGGTFEGKISADKSVIAGTWTQAGRSFPLSLQRSNEKP